MYTFQNDTLFFVPTVLFLQLYKKHIHNNININKHLKYNIWKYKYNFADKHHPYFIINNSVKLHSVYEIELFQFTNETPKL